MEKNRLEILIEKLDLNKTEFTLSIGKKRIQDLSKYFSGERRITKKLAETIIRVYPHVNYDWLRYGKGKMLMNSTAPAIEHHNKDDTEKELLKEEIKILRNRVELLEKENLHLKGNFINEVYKDNPGNKSTKVK